ncbi:ClbS/DfsB family four-helix bundle protein [Sphingobacterium spiritivorum]|uniref:ClbS/DfsB family four-helix bundle protein n=1 Tax=Sphingobacterium spiritivorum TaxID=258 RepID=UPI00191AAA63|nr:ClbS/DfsB family four-helix bundle protein [Sphingobacterium spiritivorum]QQT24962.1 ClbS/DfsB family four-helix bundle protein [Sphingobacterium spiritivorum]
MAIPTNKEQLLKAIKNNYDKLQKELTNISLAHTTMPELEGHAKGTYMSIHNLVSYLIGWGELVLKWNRKKDLQETVDFPETGYKWNQLGLLAQKFYKDYETIPYPELLKRLDTTAGDIIQLITRKTNHELYEEAWYEKWTLGRMIQFNTASPYTNATARIRKWKKLKGTAAH